MVVVNQIESPMRVPVLRYLYWLPNHLIHSSSPDLHSNYLKWSSPDAHPDGTGPDPWITNATADDSLISWRWWIRCDYCMVHGNYNVSDVNVSHWLCQWKTALTHHYPTVFMEMKMECRYPAPMTRLKSITLNTVCELPKTSRNCVHLYHRSHTDYFVCCPICTTVVQMKVLVLNINDKSQICLLS